MDTSVREPRQQTAQGRSAQDAPGPRAGHMGSCQDPRVLGKGLLIVRGAMWGAQVEAPGGIVVAFPLTGTHGLWGKWVGSTVGCSSHGPAARGGSSGSEFLHPQAGCPFLRESVTAPTLHPQLCPCCGSTHVLDQHYMLLV